MDLEIVQIVSDLAPQTAIAFLIYRAFALYRTKNGNQDHSKHLKAMEDRLNAGRLERDEIVAQLNRLTRAFDDHEEDFSSYKKRVSGRITAMGRENRRRIEGDIAGGAEPEISTEEYIREIYGQQADQPVQRQKVARSRRIVGRGGENEE